MRLQSKRSEFKAKIASNSSAIAKIFNAVIVSFECSIANHDLFSGSLAAGKQWMPFRSALQTSHRIDFG